MEYIPFITNVNYISERNHTHDKCNLTRNTLEKESATEAMHRELNPI